MSELTHIPVTLDQSQIQTIQAALVALQISAANTNAYLNEAVRAALEAANRNVDVPPVPKPNGHLNGFADAP